MVPSPTASRKGPSRVPSLSAEFEARIRSTGDWRAVTLGRLREFIKKADPEVVEELKWRKPSNPGGDPVWSHDGIVCVGNTLKLSVRLTFPKGRSLSDPKGLFNSRLDSSSVRAIDYFEGVAVDGPGLKAIVRGAVRLNSAARAVR